MTARTSMAYDAVWDFILQMFPELRMNLKTYTGDCERTLINSIKNKFSEADYCNFSNPNSDLSYLAPLSLSTK